MSWWEPLVTLAPVGTVLGGLGKFIWDRVEKRLSAIEKNLQECHARELVEGDRRSKLSQMVELLMMLAHRQAPTAPELHRSKQLLVEYNALAATPDVKVIL